MTLFLQVALGVAAGLLIGGLLGRAYIAVGLSIARWRAHREAVDALAARDGVIRLGWWETNEGLQHRVALVQICKRLGMQLLEADATLRGLGWRQDVVVVPRNAFWSRGGDA